MSGIKTSRTGKIHAEGTGEGGDAATLCGRGADYIEATSAEVDCKSCLKIQAAREPKTVPVRRYSVQARRGEGDWVVSPAHSGYTDVRDALDAAERCASLVTDSQWRVVAGDEVVWVARVRVAPVPALAFSGAARRPGDLVDGPVRRRYRKHKPSGRSRARW